MYWRVACYGSIPVVRADEGRPSFATPITGRATIDRETVHVHDIAAPEELSRVSRLVSSRCRGRPHASSATPLLRKGVASARF